MTTTPSTGGNSPDPAENQTENVADDAKPAPGTFTERGEEAEQAAYLGEGAYSGGEFAGGDLPDRG